MLNEVMKNIFLRFILFFYFFNLVMKFSKNSAQFFFEYNFTKLLFIFLRKCDTISFV